jgi:uncharacterized protein (TIGR03663 family)
VQQAAGITQNIKSFFTFERIFILILILAFFLRFSLLDLKLLHHDEALHAKFCYDLLTKGTWQYDPSYHGPFLYYVTTGLFALIGPSDFAARVLPSLFGLCIIPLVWCIHRIGYISKIQALVVALFIAISPDMVYFSRFLRHDIFMLFFTMLLLVAILYYFERGQTRFALLAAVAAACALCCKEEMPVIIILFSLIVVFFIRNEQFILPKHWKTDLLLATLLVITIMSIFYSAFFNHPETLVGQHFNIAPQGFQFDMKTTGWYQAIEHWTNMHNLQRLGGPFYFYVPLFLLYELPIFLLAIIGTVRFMTEGLHPALFFEKVKTWIRERRFSLPTDEPPAASLQQVQGGEQGNRKSMEFFRFCILWMLGTMAFYAYIGEKVPWLILPQLLPMCFVATYQLNWQKIAFALAGCIFLVIMTWHVAFVPADISEPIVQVQNSEDMREVMGLMDNANLTVIASTSYWPLPWYYRGDRWGKVKLYRSMKELDTMLQMKPDVIIFHDTESYPSLPGYGKKTYRLSYWFSSYDNQDRLPEYYLRRDGKLGSINIDVFTPDRVAVTT